MDNIRQTLEGVLPTNTPQENVKLLSVVTMLVDNLMEEYQEQIKMSDKEIDDQVADLTLKLCEAIENESETRYVETLDRFIYVWSKHSTKKHDVFNIRVPTELVMEPFFTLARGACPDELEVKKWKPRHEIWTVGWDGKEQRIEQGGLLYIQRS
jgi:hypothetical protein